jgi:osmoprotectant transport system ATP-binding protein
MISCVGLSKRIGGSSLVEGISFGVPRGQLLALVGGSGSGKTTTLRMLNRLIEPSSGTVLLDGERTSALQEHVLRRRIGYVFQGIGLFPHLTVAQNIGVTPSLLGWDATRIEARVTRLLNLMELDEQLAQRFPHELSGGQQQRVAFARALAAHPRVLLLDEPFAALDPLTRERLQRRFRELQRELQVTTVFVTHDMVEALTLADRIAVMREGRLIQIGAPHELLSSPVDDYVAALFEAPRRQALLFNAISAEMDRHA